MSLNSSHRILLSLSVSAIILAMQIGPVNSQQISASGGAKITGPGPIYTDVPGGNESVKSSGAGSLITLDPTTAGRITAGSAFADSGGIKADDTDFKGGSRTGAAVLASYQNTADSALIELYNSTITTVSPTDSINHASRGLEARHSIVKMTGGSITSRLDDAKHSVGVLAWSGDTETQRDNDVLAKITLNGVKVNVSDEAGNVKGTGAEANEGGQIIINDSSFTVGHKDNSNPALGDDTNPMNIGLHSTGVTTPNKGSVAGIPSLVSVDNSFITVHGDNAYGALLEKKGLLESSNTDFTVTGDGSVGVAIADGSSADIFGGVISTSGAVSTGLALDGEATATLTDTTVVSNGIVASFTDDNTTGSTANLSVDNSQLTGLDGIFSADNGDATITLTDSSAITTGDLINAANASDIVMTARRSLVEGNINDDNTSTISVLLEDSSTFTGSMNAALGEIDIDQTSRWTITNGSLFASLNNNGIVSFASILGDKSIQTNYNTLSLENYSGNTGTINFNTHLGDDNSATDQLLVSDLASGTTTITVNNTGGLGAKTDEGIQLIVAPSSQSDTFTLAGDYSSNSSDAVVAGAYAYRLHQGNSSGSNDTDWFLRSELKDGTAEYQAGAPIYEAYPQALLGLNGVSTLQQRVGNRVWAGNGNDTISQGADAIEAYAPSEEAGTLIEGNGVWGRIEGSHTYMEPNSSLTGTKYNQDVFKMQAGIDGLLNETQNGKLIGGVQLHYIHGNTKTKSANYADGKISTDGYGFSGTLTWYDEDGFYADGQVQFTWYDSDLTTSAYGAPTLAKGNNGFGYTLSMETGKRVTLNDAWSITPQGQLVYSHVKFDDFTDAFGATVDLDRAQSLQGRLGFTLDRPSSWQNDNGMISRSNIYGLANMYYEFLNGTKTDVAGVSFANKNDRLWAGVGMGGSYNWNDDKYSVYGEGLINTSLNNFGDSYTVKGNIGFRVKW